MEGVAAALLVLRRDGIERIASAEKAEIRFVEVALRPLSFQATFGADPQQIYARAEEMIEGAIVLLKARGDLTPLH